MIKNALPLSFLLSMSLHSLSYADMTAYDFSHYIRSTPESKGIALVYINAAYSAFQAANIRLINRGQKPIFCAPGNIIITEEQMSAWLIDEINGNEHAEIGNINITIILGEVLASRFPCEE